METIVFSVLFFVILIAIIIVLNFIPVGLWVSAAAAGAITRAARTRSTRTFFFISFLL